MTASDLPLPCVFCGAPVRLQEPLCERCKKNMAKLKPGYTFTPQGYTERDVERGQEIADEIERVSTPQNPVLNLPCGDCGSWRAVAVESRWLPIMCDHCLNKERRCAIEIAGIETRFEELLRTGEGRPSEPIALIEADYGMVDPAGTHKCEVCGRRTQTSSVPDRWVCPGCRDPLRDFDMDVEGLEEKEQCDCGGPPNHVPNGILCRRKP